MVYKFRDVHTHQAVPLPPGEYLIGREDECAIHIDNGSVSRRHAQIINNDAGVFVEDLGSSNGTAVRGQVISRRTALQVNDVVYFGSVCYRLEPEVVTEDSPAPTVQTPRGLKPAGRASALHKATDRVPLLGSIHFDDKPASATTEPTPVTRERLIRPTTHLPKVSPEELAAAESQASRPVTPVAVAPTLIPATTEPAAPVRTEPCPPWKLTLTMTFGAGMLVGLLAGVALGYFVLFAGK